MVLRIKAPNLADYQRRIVDSVRRFTITEGSTKCGKTFSHIWWIFREAHKGKFGWNYWWVAPVYSQAKIAFNRISARIKNLPGYSVNKTALEITTPIGTVLSFKTAENPDNLYGEDVYAAVIDEGSRMKEEAWHAIRSTVVATGAQVKLIGNVKGIDNWYYELARKAEAGELPNWEYFRFTADDAVAAGILPQEELDDARATYPNGIFLELFYAIPFFNTANRFAFSFDSSRHVAKTKHNPAHPTYLSFDFNRNPICCSVFQHYEGKIFGIETIKLENSNIYALCDTIKIKYPGSLFVINGDATGQASTALVTDNLNYYKVIKAKLGVSQNQLKIPTVNPKLADNQVLVNAMLEHFDIQLDPDMCKPLIYDLQFVEMLPDGTIKKGDREDPKQQADALDTFRYYLAANFSWFLKKI
jgi:hypothetical protein